MGKPKKALAAASALAASSLPFAVGQRVAGAETGVHRDSATYTVEVDRGGPSFTCSIKVESVLDFNTSRFTSRTEILASFIDDPCVTQVSVAIDYPEEDGGRGAAQATGAAYAIISVGDVASPYLSRSFSATHRALWNNCGTGICTFEETTSPK